MFVRVPSSFSRWGRSSLVLVLSGVLYASCTTSEDTEPYVPAVDGAQQPEGGGDLLDEAEACDRLKAAAEEAYDKLGCPSPDFPDCPAFVRPGGGSGCYEYSASSVEACEQQYEDAGSCRTLSPCIATAVLNTELETCEVPVVPGEGGAGGVGGGATGGAGPELGGAGGQAPEPQGGQPSAGAPAVGGAGGADGGAPG